MPVLESPNTYYIQPQCGVGTGLALGAADPGDYQAKAALVPLHSELAVWILERPAPGLVSFFSRKLRFRPRAPVGEQSPSGFLQAPYENGPAWIRGKSEIAFLGEQVDAWNLVPHGDPPWVVFQLGRNAKQNLNVAGDGPYPPGTLIYSYRWGDGQPNEVWQVIPQSSAGGVVTSVGSSSFVLDDVTVHTNAFTGGDHSGDVVGREIPVYVEGTAVGDREMTAIRIYIGGRPW